MQNNDMKRKLTFVILLLIMAGLNSSCSDNYEETVIDDNSEVLGDVIYDGWDNTDIYISNPLKAFFREELHRPRWDDKGNEHKTFFEQGEYNDEKCLMINSQQEFQDAYMGTKKLPDVDFGKYTLLIGKTWGDDSSYKLDKIVLTDKNGHYHLEAQLLHYVDRAAFSAILTIYYWYLYPKLKSKEIVTSRTVKDIREY